MSESSVSIKLKGNSGKSCLISLDDFPQVSKYEWYLWGDYGHNKIVGKLHNFIMKERPERIPQDWVIDHINRNPLDCRKINLRWVSLSFNSWNTTIQKTCSSRFRNVTWNKDSKKWQVRFLGKGKGYYKNERDAAYVAAKAAMKEWPLWASSSDLLIGENLLTREEINKLEQESAVESNAQINQRRALPVGVRQKHDRFVAVLKNKQIGVFDTAEEAKHCYNKAISAEKEREWQSHLDRQITRDAEGVAVIQLSGSAGVGRLSKVPEELWHLLTFKHSWNFSKEYAHGSWNGKSTLLHIVIFELLYPEYIRNINESIDHIDASNKLDNRKNNLRMATRNLQAYNKLKKSGCLSKYKGVSFDKTHNKWVSYITVQGKRHRLGTFKTEAAAVQALNMKAIELLGNKATIQSVEDEKSYSGFVMS